MKNFMAQGQVLVEGKVVLEKATFHFGYQSDPKGGQGKQEGSFKIPASDFVAITTIGEADRLSLALEDGRIAVVMVETNPRLTMVPKPITIEFHIKHWE